MSTITCPVCKDAFHYSKMKSVSCRCPLCPQCYNDIIHLMRERGVATCTTCHMPYQPSSKPLPICFPLSSSTSELIQTWTNRFIDWCNQKNEYKARLDELPAQFPSILRKIQPIITNRRLWYSTLPTESEILRTFSAIMSKPTLVAHLEYQLSRLSEWMVPIPIWTVPSIFETVTKSWYKNCPSSDRNIILTSTKDKLIITQSENTIIINFKGEIIKNFGIDFQGLVVDPSHRLWTCSKDSVQCWTEDGELVSKFKVDASRPKVLAYLSTNKLVVADEDQLLIYSLDGVLVKRIIDIQYSRPKCLQVNDQLWVWANYSNRSNMAIYSLDGQLIRAVEDERLSDRQHISSAKIYNHEVWFPGIHIYSVGAEFRKSVSSSIDNFLITSDGYLFAVDVWNGVKLMTPDFTIIYETLFNDAIVNIVELPDGRIAATSVHDVLTIFG